jgi:hypothetical protein
MFLGSLYHGMCFQEEGGGYELKESLIYIMWLLSNSYQFMIPAQYSHTVGLFV